MDNWAMECTDGLVTDWQECVGKEKSYSIGCGTASQWLELPPPPQVFVSN